ncbi:MAG: class I SAM-dependent methyltransferase [bacterium]|nr:class I SAM-dependent methyltransferase [bacterium]
MNEIKQVDKMHYDFGRYMTKRRWASVWHQLDEVIRLNPSNVLEIGPGIGVFKHVASLTGLTVETLDLDPKLKPDFVGSATALPFEDSHYDVVCAFQMLEHLPYESALLAFEEMVRVSRRHVVISLPDARATWQYSFHVPKLGTRSLLFPRPTLKQTEHVFDGEHYWELNKKGYDLNRVIRDLSRLCLLIKTYLVFENPYHRFFVFKRC